MKTLLLLLLLIPALANAEPRYTYDVRAVRSFQLFSTDLSCGATPRMLRDKHRIVFEGDNVWVNHTRWTLREMSTPPFETIIWFRREHAMTFVSMALWADGRKIIGYYVLTGRTPERKDCLDRVELVGERI